MCSYIKRAPEENAWHLFLAYKAKAFFVVSTLLCRRYELESRLLCVRYCLYGFLTGQLQFASIDLTLLANNMVK